MKEQDEQYIKGVFHKSADIQADIIINCVKSIDEQLPKDFTDEQRTQVLQHIITQSYKVVEESVRQLATQMLKQDINKE